MEGIRFTHTVLSFFAAAVVYLLPLDIAPRAHVMLFVMVFTVLMWITEALPLHVTAMLAAILLILVNGIDAKNVFAQFFDSTVVLLLGGFVIAVAMSKHRLDEYVAYKILGRAGTNPKMTVLALMCTATFLSMWISNSAAAAIIMPIALVFLAKNKLKPGSSNLGKASVLAVGYGATIGGIGTIIGSTPNVIAAKFIRDSGAPFGFYEWLYRGFPFMIFLMILGWLALIILFRPEKRRIIPVKKTLSVTREQKGVMAVFGLTVFLWITENIHGINSSVISLVPIILLYSLGLLSTKDFHTIDWPTLILIGGGLALGMGIHETALDASFASVLSTLVAGQGIVVLFLMLGLFGTLITLMVSNTTAASVYLPIVTALAASFGADISNIVVAAAIGVSLDFIFPFGTPPTAIAYGTKYVTTKDIAKAGVVIATIGVFLLALLGIFW